VLVRVTRMAEGNLGDVKPVGEGVSETRIDYGPGYRLYFAGKGKSLIVLLAGGDKKSQAKDIKAAKALWKDWKEENG
jgi:putative addiction module killer protein